MANQPVFQERVIFIMIKTNIIHILHEKILV